MLGELIAQSWSNLARNRTRQPPHHARASSGASWRWPSCMSYGGGLPRRPGPGLRRLRQERGRGLAGPDQRAGGRGAGRAPGPSREGRPGRDPGRGHAWSRHVSMETVRWLNIAYDERDGQHRDPGGLPGVRRDPQRGAERGPLDQPRGLRGAAAGGRSSGSRLRKKLFAGRPGGGGDGPHRRGALHRDRAAWTARSR